MRWENVWGKQEVASSETILPWRQGVPAKDFGPKSPCRNQKKKKIFFYALSRLRDWVFRRRSDCNGYFTFGYSTANFEHSVRADCVTVPYLFLSDSCRLVLFTTSDPVLLQWWIFSHQCASPTLQTWHLHWSLYSFSIQTSFFLFLCSSYRGRPIKRASTIVKGQSYDTTTKVAGILEQHNPH